MIFRQVQAAAAALYVTTFVLIVADPANADSVRDDQWHLRSLNVAAAHKVTRGAGVTIAVVDSGVDPHPDLRRNLLQGTTVLPGDKGNGQTDEDGHGTMMAGIIAAHGQSGQQGVLGIAPEAKILPVKESKPGNNGGTTKIAAGIVWAVKHQANVVNVSLASGPSADLSKAVKQAVENDVVVVAGSGNRGTQFELSYPAALPGVLAVGSTDRSGKVANFTVTGKEMGICAPGVDIMSTGANKKYFTSWGTSHSTAIVSGAAALVRAKFPDLSAPEVIHRLQATATDIGKPGRDEECGFGVLNVVKALTADVPPLTTGSASTPPTTPSTKPAPATSSPGTSQAAPNTTPASSNTPAIIGGSVIVLLFGGLIAMLVNRRRKNPPAM